MQQPIPILPQLPALNWLKDAAKVEAIDYTADFENLFTCLDSIEKFIHTGRSNKVYTWNNNTSASRSTLRNLNKKSVCSRYL